MKIGPFDLASAAPIHDALRARKVASLRTIDGLDVTFDVDPAALHADASLRALFGDRLPADIPLVELRCTACDAPAKVEGPCAACSAGEAVDFPAWVENRGRPRVSRRLRTALLAALALPVLAATVALFTLDPRPPAVLTGALANVQHAEIRAVFPREGHVELGEARPVDAARLRSVLARTKPSPGGGGELDAVILLGDGPKSPALFLAKDRTRVELVTEYERNGSNFRVIRTAATRAVENPHALGELVGP